MAARRGRLAVLRRKLHNPRTRHYRLCASTPGQQCLHFHGVAGVSPLYSAKIHCCVVHAHIGSAVGSGKVGHTALSTPNQHGRNLHRLPQRAHIVEEMRERGAHRADVQHARFLCGVGECRPLCDASSSKSSSKQGSNAVMTTTEALTGNIQCAKEHKAARVGAGMTVAHLAARQRQGRQWQRMTSSTSRTPVPTRARPTTTARSPGQTGTPAPSRGSSPCLGQTAAGAKGRVITQHSVCGLR